MPAEVDGGGGGGGGGGAEGEGAGKGGEGGSMRDLRANFPTNVPGP